MANGWFVRLNAAMPTLNDYRRACEILRDVGATAAEIAADFRLGDHLRLPRRSDDDEEATD